MQLLKRDLALAQLRLRSITAGCDLNCSNDVADALIIEVGPEQKVAIVRPAELGGRRQIFEIHELIALARIESDSPARGPVAEQAIPLGEPPRRRFGGDTFDPEKDEVRLSEALTAVRDVMASGAWLTIDEIDRALSARGHHVSVPGISARIRDLRKPQFGGHVVERQRVEGVAGLWRYRLTLRAAS